MKYLELGQSRSNFFHGHPTHTCMGEKQALWSGLISIDQYL